MITVLVTGANGQLARCIAKNLPNNSDFEFLFYDSLALNISSHTQVKTLFETHRFDWCVNCAAYTAVDKAESNVSNAHAVNVEGPLNIANECQKYGTKLIHISTDFVFDGKHYLPYTETSTTNPINAYGRSKLEGEKKIVSVLKNHFIIRTSWLYSEFGYNFFHTMLRLSEKGEPLKIVDDQIGTPTYAGDLANLIHHIISTNSSQYGLYHYSNEGVASWYDFAKAIFDLNNIKIPIEPIPSVDFPTPAKRPHFSVLNKAKIKAVFNIYPPYWKDSLKKVILSLK